MKPEEKDDLDFRKIIDHRDAEIVELKNEIAHLKAALQDVMYIQQYGPQKAYAKVGDCAPAWDDCCDGGR